MFTMFLKGIIIDFGILNISRWDERYGAFKVFIGNQVLCPVFVYICWICTGKSSV